MTHNILFIIVITIVILIIYIILNILILFILLSISNLDKKKRIKEKVDEAIKNKIITETNRDKINSKKYHLHKNKNKKRGSVNTKMTKIM